MLRKYRFENWTVAFRRHCPDVLFDNEPFNTVKNPLLFWAADPFVVHAGDDYYIFAELYNRLTYKGDIRYCIIKNNGTVTKWKKALNTGKHLSFPLIYKENGEYYMMPESSKADNLKIFKATSFPGKWVESKTLAQNVKYADSVFLDEKHILTYDNYSRPRKAILLSLEDDGWVEKQNIADPAIVYRPAGKAFTFENETYLPFQDSSSGEYGGSMRFSKIEMKDGIFRVLDDVLTVLPDSINVEKIKSTSIVGVHTYNFNDEIEVIDIKESIFNVFSFIGYCIKKLFN